MTPEPVFGLLNVNKPTGPTSHDIVAMVRRGTKIRKIGHAGTLDPLARGVLVLCLGPATRLSEYVMRSPKTYRARVKLGVTTDTYDAEGRVVAEHPLAGLQAARVEEALQQFRGDIQQVPPMYSAIKQGGKVLYNLAREGKEVHREPRSITVHSLTLADVDLPFVTLDIACSSGTYIRSIAHDLGQVLGVGGYLVDLTRVASGQFRVDDAVPLAELQQAMTDGDWRRYLLPPELALSELPAVTVDADELARIQHGNGIAVPEGITTEARVHTPDGRLLALARVQAGQLRPVKVFLSE